MLLLLPMPHLRNVICCTPVPLLFCVHGVSLRCFFLPGILLEVAPGSLGDDGALGLAGAFDRSRRCLLAGGIMSSSSAFEPHDARCGGGDIFGGADFGGAVGRSLAVCGSNGTLTTGALYGLACGTCVSGSSSPLLPYVYSSLSEYSYSEYDTRLVRSSVRQGLGSGTMRARHECSTSGLTFATGSAHTPVFSNFGVAGASPSSPSPELSEFSSSQSCFFISEISLNMSMFIRILIVCAQLAALVAALLAARLAAELATLIAAVACIDCIDACIDACIELISVDSSVCIRVFVARSFLPGRNLPLFGMFNSTIVRATQMLGQKACLSQTPADNETMMNMLCCEVA